MADAMVTGRMSQAKKRAGNSVLSSLGMSASQAINQLYDYLIAQNATPFERASAKPANNAQLHEALAFVQSVPRQSNFTHMSDTEIKRSKLAARGFVPSDGSEK